MKKNTSHYKRGFTLIETMVAVLLLTIALSALLGLTSSSLFAARYARNEITANYLMQEAADYVRNDRDTLVLHDTTGTGAGWTSFIAKYAICTVANGGCFVEPSNPPAGVYTRADTCGSAGVSVCPVLKYSQGGTHNAYYTYQNDIGRSPIVSTTFRRQVIFTQVSPDEVDVVVNMLWLNGNAQIRRSLAFSIFNWNK